MRFALSFHQRMRGSYWLLGAPADERPVELAIEARVCDVRQLVRKSTWRVTGTIFAEGLAARAPLAGTLAFHLIDERRVGYRFAFQGDDHRGYEMSGQGEWSGLSPIHSLTLLPASLYDQHGEEIGRATLRFDLAADWARWLKSFRLRWEPYP